MLCKEASLVSAGSPYRLMTYGVFTPDYTTHARRRESTSSVKTRRKSLLRKELYLQMAEQKLDMDFRDGVSGKVVH